MIIERSSGGENGNPLQYFCLENSMNRGAWQATVREVAKSWTWLCIHACKVSIILITIVFLLYIIKIFYLLIQSRQAISGCLHTEENATQYQKAASIFQLGEYSTKKRGGNMLPSANFKFDTEI